MSTTKKWLESVLISNGHEEFIDIMLIYNREKTSTLESPNILHIHYTK